MVRRGFSVKIEEYGISLFEQLPAPNLALSLSKTDTEKKKKIISLLLLLFPSFFSNFKYFPPIFRDFENPLYANTHPFSILARNAYILRHRYDNNNVFYWAQSAPAGF